MSKRNRQKRHFNMNIKRQASLETFPVSFRISFRDMGIDTDIIGIRERDTFRCEGGIESLTYEEWKKLIPEFFEQCGEEIPAKYFCRKHTNDDDDITQIWRKASFLFLLSNNIQPNPVNIHFLSTGCITYLIRNGHPEVLDYVTVVEDDVEPPEWLKEPLAEQREEFESTIQYEDNEEEEEKYDKSQEPELREAIDIILPLIPSFHRFYGEREAENLARTMNGTQREAPYTQFFLRHGLEKNRINIYALFMANRIFFEKKKGGVFHPIEVLEWEDETGCFTFGGIPFLDRKTALEMAESFIFFFGRKNIIRCMSFVIQGATNFNFTDKEVKSLNTFLIKRNYQPSLENGDCLLWAVLQVIG